MLTRLIDEHWLTARAVVGFSRPTALAMMISKCMATPTERRCRALSIHYVNNSANPLGKLISHLRISWRRRKRTSPTTSGRLR